jgi:hypothetical protein
MAEMRGNIRVLSPEILKHLIHIAMKIFACKGSFWRYSKVGQRTPNTIVKPIIFAVKFSTLIIQLDTGK